MGLPGHRAPKGEGKEREPEYKMWSRWMGKSNAADGRQIEAGVPALKWGWGSNYVGNESGQIVLLSLVRWVKPLPRPRFPRLSDNKWLPTLSLSVFCFLSNKTSHRKRARETGSKSDRRVGKGERGPPWSTVIWGSLVYFPQPQRMAADKAFLMATIRYPTPGVLPL